MINGSYCVGLKYSQITDFFYLFFFFLSNQNWRFPVFQFKHLFSLLYLLTYIYFLKSKWRPTYMQHFYEHVINPFCTQTYNIIYIFTVSLKFPHARWWWRWECSCPSRHGTKRALLAADKSSSLQPLVEVNQASVAVGDRGRKASVGGECGDTSCTKSKRETNEPLQRR